MTIGHVATGDRVKIHAYLDTCSTRTLIDETLAKRLRLRKVGEEVLHLKPYNAKTTTPRLLPSPATEFTGRQGRFL
ncbi:hypothetical protein L596_026325 [Steinernema carpocapsae]|uniref:Uncharacterized protein n=1 Tax=Steinernema carpocapsae TaxID=34508 RepID=A0A4U5M109_STECR|nr:hypothetical protein L596_026325 [Steinernema carpocapsae]